MRVCVVQGVVPTYRTAVFNALGRREGIELTVWAGLTAPGAPKTDDPGRFSSFSFRESPVRKIGPFWSQPAQLEARKYGFDVIVYSWSTRYVQLLPALALTRRAGVGSVVWGHGDGAGHSESRLRRRVRNGIGELADAVLVYSNGTAQDIRRRMRAPEKVFVALNAMDQTTVAIARRSWEARPDQLGRFRSEQSLGRAALFVFLSRLLPTKRTVVLLEACAQLVSEGRDVRLAVIGDGVERPALEADAARLGIGERVRFLGALYDDQQIAPWCLSAVACVVPASIGLSLLHAFGYGLPVLTTNEGAGPEIEALDDGVNGALLPPGNLEALVQSLRSVLDDRELRQAWSAAAYATVTHGKFTLERMVDGMVNAIEYADRANRAI